MKKILMAAVAATALLSAPASAAVIYDPASGGTIGKGDVQDAFGWNNTAFQQDIRALQFSYEKTSEYEGKCTAHWQTQETFTNKGGTHTKTVNHKVSGVKTHVGSINANVVSTLTGKKVEQITHIAVGAVNLAGAQVTGLPAEGSACTVVDDDGVSRQGKLGDLVEVQVTGEALNGTIGLDTMSTTRTFWSR
jgi:opacity protein-like surface antigen